MAGPKIKFCGITRPEDALAAAELGVEFIGLNFCTDSPRRIDLVRAKEIVRSLPESITPVGLFVDAPQSQIQSTADELGLRYVQLHGSEPPKAVEALKSLSVIKVIRIMRGRIGNDLAPWLGIENVTSLLLETGSTKQLGGSGIENDWAAIREHQVAGGFNGFPLITVAGGLRPQNVASVVELLQPWMVDVSSGIESAPGIKSPEKMTAFVRAVRGH